MKHLKSLREYLDILKELGELQEIDQEVDWNLEMGAIIRRSYDLQESAPLFNKIRDIKPGFRAFGAPAGISKNKNQRMSRVAVSLGLPSDTPAPAIVDYLAKARSRQPIPSRLLSTGPCKENILLGDDIDLYKFPVPFIHGYDGGRYINT
jgi:UbiD family decarboxylase